MHPPPATKNKSSLFYPSMPWQDRTRPDLLSDDTQRRYAHDIQGFQVPEVTKQLEDFR